MEHLILVSQSGGVLGSPDILASIEPLVVVYSHSRPPHRHIDFFFERVSNSSAWVDSWKEAFTSAWLARGDVPGPSGARTWNR